MEKQIETVYVPTKESRGSFTLDDLNKTMVINTKAYLYTPEEHAAVQGYREALEKISDECTRTDISITHIVGVVSNALSKAEDKGEGVKDCSLRINGKTMAETLAPQPTNSSDELERWVNKEIESKGKAYDEFDEGISIAYQNVIDQIKIIKQNNP